MTVSTVAHLNFRGDARAALEFYRSVFDGELVVVTNGDMGVPVDPSEIDQVKWGQVADADGVHVMAYDVPAEQPWSRGQDSFFLSLRGETADEVTALWKGLCEGATVRVPLEPAQWAPLYGMLTDRFGITWVVDVAVPYDAS
ncbi:VOC family protein [Pseudonocardia sp. KRD291]|uniref:VOC family protein n=1 Tax=Pseudonocardia sp. KRD291 TaxID=2792007 RepID=UPI001C4A4B0C|nr:VOC family protein [Pseudonocardia sp. KRD291]MBW0104751.1 VOC family protein [Pseudonocardia sp. KRD291]